jgi:hypothetical protein
MPFPVLPGVGCGTAGRGRDISPAWRSRRKGGGKREKLGNQIGQMRVWNFDRWGEGYRGLGESV